MITVANDITSTPYNPFSKNDFEVLYSAVRKKEARLYTDEEVALLPVIAESHIHYKEWQLRKRSAERLLRYIQNKNRSLSILEVGCGNGWLSAKMATLKNITATGIDINGVELAQASKVFADKNNLCFLETDIRATDLDKRKFDMIIFAASIQYFSSPDEVISKACSLLNKGGEIHILDSHFYNSAEIEKAAQRTLSYYRSIGHEEMNRFYFHHSINALKKYNYTLLYHPSSAINKLLGKKDPFPWIRILT